MTCRSGARTRQAQRPIRSGQAFDAARARRGYAAFQDYCMACHGDNAVSGGVLPDLRWSGTLENAEGFNNVVGRGVLTNYGMVGFDKVLTPAEIEDIRMFLISRSN
ncbi:c-type cytochrome [Komagataeibacter melomenusus]|nr:c-type cytochrome [Komagataeibacter melomenusus]